MKSLLVGNGINIQFGNKAYTSEYIMKRIKYKAKLGCYDKLFGGKIDGKEIAEILNAFVQIANDILDNRYDEYVTEDELNIVLADFKSRYNKISASHEIMLEDWMFVLHMFFLKESDIADKLQAAEQGFKSLILDGIYNDGKIQELYKNIPREAEKKIKRYFLDFDNIFTLNYDNNLEKLIKKNVYHLHGDFSVLDKSENIENVLGFIRAQDDSRVFIEGMEHCFCNALLDYSGHHKLKEAMHNHKLIIESETFKERYDNDESFKEYLLSIKESSPNNYNIIMTKIMYPRLKIATEYYFDEFKNIKDELHIVGMSPNNDSHIFECIEKNKKIKRVYFYYYSEYEKNIIESINSDVEYIAKNVIELWDSLNFKNKKYNTNYENLDEKIDKFIDIFNGFSEDYVSKDNLIWEIKSIPIFEAIRLCKLVKEDLEKRNPNHASTDEDTFNKTRHSISLIALSEGVLPSVLFALYIIHRNSIK